MKTRTETEVDYKVSKTAGAIVQRFAEIAGKNFGIALPFDFKQDVINEVGKELHELIESEEVRTMHILK